MKNLVSINVSNVVAQMDAILDRRAKQLLLNNEVLSEDFTLTHFRSMRNYIDSLNQRNSGYDNKVAELENKANIALQGLEQAARNLAF